VRVADILLRHFGHMHQAILLHTDIHERAEVYDVAQVTIKAV